MKLLKIILCIVVFYFTAFSQAVVKINSFTSLKPNTLISIPVEVSGMPNISSITLEIQFDPTVVKFNGLSKYHNNIYPTYHCANGVLKYIWFSLNPDALLNDVLCNLDIEYLGGISDINFVTSNCQFSNSDLQRYQVTYKNGFLSTSTLDVAEKNKAYSSFNLEQNYPNPFNPSTIIAFSLPEAAKTRVAIYNITGSEVAELVNSTLNAGQHEYIFNASNLSSGVYLYKITSGKFSCSKKMFLVK